MDLQNAAEVSVVPYAVRFFALLFVGQLADWLLRGGVSLSLLRKGMTSASLLVPALALLIMAVSELPEIVAVSLLVVGVGLSGAANVGAIYGPIEMYPDTAGGA